MTEEEDTDVVVDVITKLMRDVHVREITIRKMKARVRVEVEVMTKKNDIERRVANQEVTDCSLKKELNDYIILLY
jgi:hypothetical protein